MLNHYSFIPYELTNVPEGSSLIFAPHPDDETLGLGGTILRLTGLDRRVSVVMMTDGAEGGDPDVRREEFIRVADLLGVNETHFFGEKDGRLEVENSNVKKIITLLEHYQPDNIFFPSPFEYHPDHRATAWLVWNALQSVGFAGDVYSYEIANQSPVNMLVDITSTMRKKAELMRLYRSQNEQVDYVDIITSINRSRAYTVSSKETKYVEAFFKFPHISMDLMSYYYQRLHTYHQGMKTEKLPLVSILIRTKDRLDRLRYALESILKQTYQQIEVNIVNDGGVDIRPLVESFQFDRVSLTNHEQSKGRAAAANTLLRMVKGEYAIFLDDDDTFDPDHIENLVKVIRQNENMLAAYSGIRVGEGIDRPPFNQPYNAALLRRMNFIPFHAVLFSRKLIDDGCVFDESLEVYEDWDFWLQIAQRTEFYHVDKITATYNINGQSGAGGAGGQEIRGRDLNYWTLKVYEKWQTVWSARQIAQTFDALANLNTAQAENVEKMEVDAFERSEITARREESIRELQERVKHLEEINKHLNNHVNLLLEERIQEHDDGDDSFERRFALHSTRGRHQQCMELFQEVFGEKMTQAFWDWKYAPHGMRWRGVCAVKGDRVIGHYNGAARAIRYFGRYKLAVQACDTMVSPKERGGFGRRSPFYAMTRMFLALNVGERKPFVLSFGFPNKRAMMLGEKTGFYSEVDTMTEVEWRIGEHSHRPSGYIESYTAENFPADEVQSVWNTMAAEFKEEIIGVRDRNYLIHRYFRHPKFDYKVYGIRDAEKKLTALFVLKREGKSYLLMDIVTSKTHFSEAIAGALSVLSEENEVSLLRAWCTTSKQTLFDHYGARQKQTDVSVPTYTGCENFDSGVLENAWFLMFGDTDFM